MQEWFQNLFAATLGLGDLGITLGLVVSVIVKIVIILIPLILTVAYLTYFERKVIGFMQLRVGPNVTGPWGLIQPFADVFKLLFKEVTRPKLSNKALFYIGLVMCKSPFFSPWYSKICVSTIASVGQASSQKPQKMHLVRSMS